MMPRGTHNTQLPGQLTMRWQEQQSQKRPRASHRIHRYIAGVCYKDEDASCAMKVADNFQLVIYLGSMIYLRVPSATGKPIPLPMTPRRCICTTSFEPCVSQQALYGFGRDFIHDPGHSMRLQCGQACRQPGIQACRWHQCHATPTLFFIIILCTQERFLWFFMHAPCLYCVHCSHVIPECRVQTHVASLKTRASAAPVPFMFGSSRLQYNSSVPVSL